MLPTTRFVYRKGLGSFDAILSVSHTVYGVLESGQETRIVHTDFSAAFDRANHQGILYELCSVDIGSSVLSFDLTAVMSKWLGFASNSRH